MPTIRYMLMLIVAGTVAGCGERSQNAASAVAPPANSARPTGPATAEEVAEAARGDVDCPARIETPPRAAGTAVEDVMSVRSGMTYEEAVNLVLCTHDLLVVQEDTTRRFNIETYGQTIRQGFTARVAEPLVEKTSKQIMQEMQDDMMARSGNRVTQDMQPGQSKWYVGTMGTPGQEQVISVAREEWFEAGHNPAMATVEQALIKKYGPPAKNQLSGNRHLSWIYDPQGHPVTETSPLFNLCIVNPDPNAGSSFSPDCGIVVAAMIAPMQDNRDIARYLQVGIVDQANGYATITATEQSLQQLDAQRRAEEVSKAAKNAPKL